MVEVHIPQKGIHGKLVPVPKANEDDLPDELPLLRELEDREAFAIQHLERSNREIDEALQAEDDEDLRLAVAENLEVLVRKRARLQKIREKIRQLDPNAGVAPTAADAAGPEQPAKPQAGDIGAPVAPADGTDAGLSL